MLVELEVRVDSVLCVSGRQRRLHLCGAKTHPIDPRDPPAHGRLYADGLAGTSLLTALKKVFAVTVIVVITTNHTKFQHKLRWQQKKSNYKDSTGILNSVK